MSLRRTVCERFEHNPVTIDSKFQQKLSDSFQGNWY